MDTETTVLGIDPSITSTGLVVVNAAGQVVHTEAVGSKAESESGLHIVARYQLVLSEIVKAVTQHKPQLVVMEGPALGYNNDGTFDLWGLLSVIRWELRHYLSHKALLLPTPQELKLWSTGKGNTPKDQMRLLVFKKWGLEFTSMDETEAFTFAMWGLACLRGDVVLAQKKKKKRTRKPKKSAQT